jgi:hypothetical protein
MKRYKVKKTWNIHGRFEKQFIKVAAYIEDHREKKVRIFGTI